MRPWLTLEHFQIPFEEVLIPFDDFREDQNFKQIISQVSPTGKVPVLIDTDQTIWDSLAICEYLAERHPHLDIWPKDVYWRSHARSICAEMHSGFSQLRTLCGMNISADLQEIGQQLWHDHPVLRHEVKRIEEIWQQRSFASGYLCADHFTIADAFYAPVVMRIISYGLPVGDNAQTYIRTILAVPAVQAWIDAAKQENWFVKNQEPYRTQAEADD